MNEVKNTLVRESVQGDYLTPETKVIDLLAEGVLCSSGMTEKFEDADFDWN